MKIILYGQGGYYNRGCEAIVRSTTTMIRKAFPKVEVSTAAYEYESDRAMEYGIVDNIYPHSNVRYSLPHLLAFGFRKLGMHKLDTKYQYKWFEDLLEKGDVFVSIGGDNYCYEPPLPFYHIDKMAKAAGKKIFFWGASFDKDLLDDTMVEDLKLFDGIMVRESLSYEALTSAGIKNVHLHPDPAFTMGVSQAKLPAQWKTENTIGLNLSPLAMRYSGDGNVFFDAVCKMVDYIIDSTDSNIALIPHVVDANQTNTQNDLTTLNTVLEKYKDTNRVFMIEHSKYNAKELKGFISRCRAFVGARTHSTIAAYSTGVPTLAIGYSVKARGIAKDIFGTEDKYVLPIDAIKKDTDLLDAFKYILDNEVDIRKHLSGMMQDYKQQSHNAIKRVQEVLTNE